MNRALIIAGIASALILSVSGCSVTPSDGSAPSSAESSAEQKRSKEPKAPASVRIKSSDDPHVQYIKSYVGMNARQVGYTALDGMRHDRYGNGTIKIVFITSDGSHVHLGTNDDDWDDSALEDWKVSSQSYSPNTKFTYTFASDSDGEDVYSVETQTISEVVLSLEKVDGSSSNSAKLTKIKPSADKYTYFIKDYVGRNLADCGYTSLVGTFNDQYGPTFIQFDLVAEDGSYIDPTDPSSLASYVVTSQNVAPNSELKLTYSTDSDGQECWDLTSSQKSIDSITLTVRKIQ